MELLRMLVKSFLGPHNCLVFSKHPDSYFKILFTFDITPGTTTF